MDIAPLTKKIIDLALATGVKRIVLKFSEENDKLYLAFDFDKYDSFFCKEVQDWASFFYADAMQVPFELSGTECGETFDYNLELGTVTSQKWHTKIYYADEVEEGWEMLSED